MRRIWAVPVLLIVAACAGVPPGQPSAASIGVVPSSPAAPPVTRPNIDVVSGRATHTATALPDRSVFVAGGCVVDGCAEATSDTFLLAPDGASVHAGPAMTGPRDSHTATLVNERDVVLAGGFAGEGDGVIGGVEVYRDDTGIIERLGNLKVARGGHAAAALRGGDVLVAGGWVAPRTYTATAELVDAQLGTVRDAAPMPVAADALDAVTMTDGRVLVTGGQSAPGVATAAAEIYDPATDAWLRVGPMRTPRFKHVAVALRDGRVLVIGGTTDDETILSTTEVYNPSSGEFAPGPTLAEPRYKTAGGALLLADGRVAIAGGGRSVEVIDVDAGTTAVVAEFGQRGSFATISPWGNALVVLGGYDDRITLRRDHLVVNVPSR